MPDAFGLAAIVTKFALYLGVMTAAGTVMATLMFRLDRTRNLAAGFAVLGVGAAIFAFSFIFVPSTTLKPYANKKASVFLAVA